MSDGGWCRVCGTQHALGAACPGNLDATGPERVGWRVTVETPQSMEGYGVLVAPVGDRWRARVLTFPRSLWTIPGGAGSMKFLASSPQRAERMAIDFIEQFCLQRGYVLRAQLSPVDFRGVDTERGAVVEPAKRRLRAVPVRFGPRLPGSRGLTRDLSETGVFVMTAAPLGPGLDVNMRLETDVGALSLMGTVVWNRGAPERGRPAGMGVWLRQPPSTYVSYVRSL